MNQPSCNEQLVALYPGSRVEVVGSIPAFRRIGASSLGAIATLDDEHAAVVLDDDAGATVTASISDLGPITHDQEEQQLVVY